MKKQIKRITAVLCAVALFVTGLNFMPQSAKAADTWFNAVFDTPETTPPTPWYHHHTSAVTEDDEAGIWDYTGPGGATAKYLNGEKVQGFAWNLTKANNEANWLETDNLMDVACVKKDGEWVKPTPGMSYKLNMTIDYTNNTNGDTQLQIWNTNGYDGEIEHKDVEANYIFNPRKGNIQWSCENVDVFLMPGNEFKVHLGVGVNASYKYNYKITAGCTFTISKFELVPDGEYEVVPSNDDTFKPSADVGGQTIYSPWTLSAHYVPSATGGSYGVMLYNVDPAEAENIEGTTMKLASTVGEPEKDAQGHRIVDPADRWWWISASLLDCAEDVGLEEKYDISSGTISLYSSKATDEDCYLYVYVDNTEYQFALSEGDNTLTIPDFIYAGGKDIRFLFDELPKNTVIKVNDITFEQEADSWNTVPNADPTFTEGPWNMFGNFIDEPDIKGNYGVLQYKTNTENPSSYKDYDFRVASNSGWEAYSVFARLEDYCSDYFDEGGEYDVTIKLNSSKATVPTADEKDLDQLLVLVGADKYYFDLQENQNTLTIHGDSYKLNPSEPHEQIMLEMDGLQKGTVLTVTDIQVSGPNDGWTNVPNKQDTAVGDWTLFAWKDETHWSKMAYKDNGTDSGLGAYDIKLRRTTPNGGATNMASLATLTDYLATVKDTKGRPIAHADEYEPVVTIKATGQADSVNDYGMARALINGQAFDFHIKKGTNTYNLYDIFGQKMIYDNSKTNDVQFELDEVMAKSILTISKVEFIGPDDESQDVPNGTAFKPEGTPWTLYAITDPDTNKYGAMRYEIVGSDPSQVSSVKMTLKSVSGWFGARSIRATLNSYLEGLEIGKQYKITVKMNVDESGVAAVDKDPEYEKKLRMTVDNVDYDFNVDNPAIGTQTFEKLFTYTGTSKHVAFDFDQLLKGSRVSFASIEITDPTAPTTTVAPTTEAPTGETTTVAPSTTVVPTTPETTKVVPTTMAPSTEAPSEPTTESPSEPTTESPSEPTTEAPTGETTTVVPQTSDVTTKSVETTIVKVPGKAKIKKVYKKKKSAKKLKLKLKKIKDAKGYQVAVYKTKKKAKRNKKALVKKYVKKLKVTIKSKKLKNKKKLYVRARAYVLDGNGLKVFGKWSAIKKVKIKK